jgi:hypothetical protein
VPTSMKRILAQDDRIPLHQVSEQSQLACCLFMSPNLNLSFEKIFRFNFWHSFHQSNMNSESASQIIKNNSTLLSPSQKRGVLCAIGPTLAVGAFKFSFLPPLAAFRAGLLTYGLSYALYKPILEKDGKPNITYLRAMLYAISVQYSVMALSGVSALGRRGVGVLQSPVGHILMSPFTTPVVVAVATLCFPVYKEVLNRVS